MRLKLQKNLISLHLSSSCCENIPFGTQAPAALTRNSHGRTWFWGYQFVRLISPSVALNMPQNTAWRSAFCSSVCFGIFIFLPQCFLHNCCCPINSEHSCRPSTACPTSPGCKQFSDTEEAESCFLLLALPLTTWMHPSLLTPLHCKPLLSWGYPGTGTLCITALKQDSFGSACNAVFPWAPL